MADLKKILDSCPSYCEIGYARSDMKDPDEHGMKRPDRAVVVLSVGKTGWGFGEFSFVQDENGKLFVDTECTSLKTAIGIITEWLGTATTDWDEDPEKHKRYNEVMQRSCGERCKVCYPKDEEK